MTAVAEVAATDADTDAAFDATTELAVGLEMAADAAVVGTPDTKGRLAVAIRVPETVSNSLESEYNVPELIEAVETHPVSGSFNECKRAIDGSSIPNNIGIC